MSAETQVGIRRSVHELQMEYNQGNRQPLEDVVRAWKGIKELPPTDPHSFFVLGGFHGEPFVIREGAKAEKLTYWGGYCNHGNVLFPTWHRVYVRKIEEALQTIVPGVMMPYWDETDKASMVHGVPAVLTNAKFELDGELIDNPLRSFVLPEEVDDAYWGDNQKGEKMPYYKPKGYETVRYPLSGLVGNPEDRAKTAAHNAQFPDYEEQVHLLNLNYRTWLHGGNPTPETPDPQGVGLYTKFARCLSAPNYTVFSNTTSAAAWNKKHKTHTVALESPHNDVHLSVGGYDLPALGGDGSTSGQIAGANGDMGENNTAALDPIFFFHHCNIDRMFWLWQKQNPTVPVEIIPDFPGTSSSDSQGPTVGVAPNTPLSMDSPLAPFRKTDNSLYTSKDCIDTESQLRYTYSPGSLEEGPSITSEKSTGHVLTVSGINRNQFQGSFVISATAEIPGEAPVSLGSEAILSRWNVQGCSNCQTHQDVVVHFPLNNLTEEQIKEANFVAGVTHRGDSLPDDVELSLSISH